ncbi:MAG: cobalamin-dependent protein [Thermoanaerobaculia bacterium]
MTRRPIRKLTLVGMSPPLAKPENPALAWDFPSYGLYRVRASLAAAPGLADLEISTLELPMLDAQEVAERILAERADLVGFSVYLWSFPTLLEAARRLRRADPALSLIFGGPSAEPPMCQLPPHRDSAAVLDALVLGEGEIAIRELLADRQPDPARWRSIPGLALPADGTWRRTPPRPLNTRLDELPSPAAMGILPRRTVTYLETFRGCPMSCSFCEWGVMESGTLFSREYLERELAAIAELEPTVIFQLDAALNLNHHAFRNLAAAEREVGCLKRNGLIALFYPSLVRDEHFEFLAGVRNVFLTVGLQSLDEQVLSAVDRRVQRDKFERIVRDVIALPNVRSMAVELILGLPTDSPEKFRSSLEQVLELGVAVRVYKCLVLPNGLMTRAPSEQAVRFDATSLLLTSSSGWSERALAEEQERLTRLADGTPGAYTADYWWYLPARSPRGTELAVA